MDLKENEKEIKGDFISDHYALLVVLLILIIFLLGFLLLLWPKYNRILEEINIARAEVPDIYFVEGELNESYLEDRKVQLISLNNLISGYQEYQANYQKDDLEKLDIILPKEGAHERLISQISSTIVRNGMVLQSINIAEQEEKNNNTKEEENLKDQGLSKKYLNISVTVSGANYRDMKALLKVFENNLRIMDITGLRFLKGEDVAIFDIKTYYLE